VLLSTGINPYLLKGLLAENIPASGHKDIVATGSRQDDDPTVATTGRLPLPPFTFALYADK
jgi:hypothetical protein